LLLYKSKALPLVAKERKMNNPVEKEKEPLFENASNVVRSIDKSIINIISTTIENNL